MTREHKLALVVGFGLILFVGILVTDHLAADARGHDGLPTARIETRPSITLLTRDDTRTPLVPDPNPTAAEPSGEIVLMPGLARPMTPLAAEGRRPVEEGPLAGQGMATPPAPRERTHVVASGETLSEIAKSAYGDAAQWRRIANANPGVDPDRLRPGTRLRIPSDDPSARRTASPREVPGGSNPVEVCTREYTVKSGDSLARIARRELGKESRWKEIIRLNGLSDETVVPGQVLTLPLS